MGQYYSTEAVETIQNLVESPGKKMGEKNNQILRQSR